MSIGKLANIDKGSHLFFIPFAKYKIFLINLLPTQLSIVYYIIDLI